MQEIKSLKLNGTNFKKLKVIIFLFLSNILFFLIFSSENKPITKEKKYSFSRVLTIKAKVNVHPKFKGEVKIFDLKTKKMIKGFHLVENLGEIDSDFSQVLVWSSTKSIDQFWNKQFIILPKFTSQHKKITSRGNHDKSF